MSATSSEIEITGFKTMASSMEFADNYNNWIINKFNPYIGSSLLEIGTGQGNFKKYLSHRVKQYVSIDIDEKVIKRAKERDSGGNYIVADAASNDFSSKLKEFSFDTVMCVNVLEHIPDHKKAIANMLQVLRPGGHLLLFVPAFQALYNDMDKLAGHCRRYRKGDINELVAGLNVDIIMNEYFNSIGGLGWWVNKLRTHKDLDSKNINKQVIIFEKYIVPVSKFINPFSKKIFGQSLLAVLKKKNK